jgi:hypothetical protein
VTRFGCGVAVVLVLALAGSAGAELTEPKDKQCRLKTAEAARGHALFLTKRIGYCHQQRLAGRIPAAVDCNDPSTWAVSGFPRGVDLETKALKRLSDRVATCKATGTLADLGYGACPAPCGAITVTDIDSLTDCVRCKAEDCTLAAVTTIFGTPALGMERPAMKCQERAGRHLTLYLKNRGFFQNVCEYARSVERIGFESADCIAIEDMEHPFYSRLRLFRQKQEKVLRDRCAAVDIGADLTSCGTDVDSLVACVAAEVQACTDELFLMAYPPVP